MITSVTKKEKQNIPKKVTFAVSIPRKRDFCFLMICAAGNRIPGIVNGEKMIYIDELVIKIFP